MLTIKAKGIDDGKNSDMIVLSNLDDIVLALTHVDLFFDDDLGFEENMGNDGIYGRLHRNEEVTLSVAIAAGDEE